MFFFKQKFKRIAKNSNEFLYMIDFEDYKEVVYDIIGAAMEVHRTIGGGLLEPIYNESLSIELKSNGIDNQREVELPCFYKGIQLEKKYRMDILVDEEICVELKSVNGILPEHRMQLFNYLRLTKKHIGILINFGTHSLSGERYGYIEEENSFVILDKNMRPLKNHTL